MKKLSLALVTLSLAACGGNGPSDAIHNALTPTASPAPAAVGGAAGTALAPIDGRQYLITSYQDGLGEIALAQRALQTSSNASVRNFAQRMITDHTRVNAELSALAAAKGVPLPTTPSAALTTLLGQLGGLTGAAFDLAYMQENATSHESDVLATRQQADRSVDANVQALAAVTLPILELHLELAEEITESLDPLAFVGDVYRGGLGEIALAQLALKTSSNSQVRDFAQRMISQHTELNQRIATLAQQRGVTLPTAASPLDVEVAAEFARFAGADFDKAYLDKNVVDHTKDLRRARLVAQDNQNNDIGNAAGVLVVAFGTHLAEAVYLDRQTAASFLYTVFQEGAASLQTAHLTIQQSTNAPLKAASQQATTEWTAVATQVRTLALARGLTLPVECSPEYTWRIAELSNQSGTQFDQQSIGLAVDQYRAEIATVTDQAQNGTDAQLKTFAQGLLPVLDTASARATLLSQQLGVPANQ